MIFAIIFLLILGIAQIITGILIEANSERYVFSSIFMGIGAFEIFIALYSLGIFYLTN